MMKIAIKRVAEYLSAKRWDDYLVILPTTFLVDQFRENLFSNGEFEGALRPRIYTFESFVDMTLAAIPSSVTWLGEVERAEILRNVIYKLELNKKYQYFRDSQKHPGIIQAISQTIGELKRAVILPHQLGAALQRQNLDSPRLLDLWLTYHSYQEFLAANHLGDRDDRYLKAWRILAEGSLTWLSAVEFAYIDFFSDPTGVQNEVFKVIKQTVPDVLIGGTGIAPAAQRLPETHLLKGWGREGEVRQAAALIKTIIRQEGLNLNQIALVCRDPAVYSPVLRLVFAEAGIPLCLDWKENLVENRLVESLLMYLYAAGDKEGWRLGKLLDNNYLVGLNNDIGECMADWARAASELKSREWLDRLEQEEPGWNPDEHQGMDWNRCFTWLNEFINIMNGICRQGTQTDIIKSIRAAMKKLKVAKNILAFPDNLDFAARTKLARRDLRAWQAFNQILNEMEAVAGITDKISMTLNSFYLKLKSYIEAESYSPDTVCRGGVQVFAPTQIRGLDFDTVIVLGLQDGEFPRSISGDWVINDRERIKLKAEFNLPTSEELYQREKVLWQMVREACRRKLWLSYPAINEDGQTVLPSLYIEAMERLLDYRLEADEPLPLVYPDNWQESCSLREAVLSLLSQGYQTIGYEFIKENEDLKRHLKNLQIVYQWRQGAHFSPWDGCFSSSQIIELLQQKYQRRVFNIGHLDTYGNCPMKYFWAVEMGLRPQPDEGTALSSLDKGTLQHQVLQQVFAGAIPDSEDDISTLVGHTLEEVCTANNFLGQQYPHPLLWEYEKQTIHKNLTNLVIYERQRLAKGHWHPAFQEWGFGMQGKDLHPASVKKPLEVNTPAGKVRLRGKIDRIDVDEANHRYAVYDYKNKTVPSRANLLQGQALQLPAYLLAAEAYLGEVDGLAFLNIAKGKIDSPLVRAEAIKRLGLGPQTKPLTEEEWQQLHETTINAIGDYFRGICRGQYPPLPNDCSYCEFTRLCLYSPGRIRAKLKGEEDRSCGLTGNNK
ncbi:MAG: PD-(D/E)XK nuclease family protein [Syntrophomonadaceae bacterium]|jgi:ATP-dependent helicase/nuclease subunit B